MADLDAADRARLEEVEVRIVTRAVERGQMVSALDLEEDEVDVFLHRALGVVDLFAFPLPEEDGARAQAVAVLYLAEDSRPFRDPDMYALGSLGVLLALAGRGADA